MADVNPGSRYPRSAAQNRPVPISPTFGAKMAGDAGVAFMPGSGVADAMFGTPMLTQDGEKTKTLWENLKMGEIADALLQLGGVAGDAMYLAGPPGVVAGGSIKSAVKAAQAARRGGKTFGARIGHNGGPSLTEVQTAIPPEDVARINSKINEGDTPAARQDPAGIGLKALGRDYTEIPFEREVLTPDVQQAPVDIEKMQGDSLIVGMSDTSTADHKIKSVDGIQLEEPVITHGGQQFINKNPDGAGWGNDKTGAKKFDQARDMINSRGGKAYFTPYAMAVPGLDYSTFVSDVLQQTVKQSPVSSKALKTFGDRIRDGWKVPSVGFADFPDFPDMKDTKAVKEYLAKNGAARRSFVRLMETPEMKKLGFPSVPAARLAVSEFDQLGAAYHGGDQLAEMLPGLVDIGHPTYSTGFKGKPAGSIGKTPLEYLVPDLADKAWRQNWTDDRNRANLGYLLQRLSPKDTAQKIDQRFIDRFMSRKK